MKAPVIKKIRAIKPGGKASRGSMRFALAQKSTVGARIAGAGLSADETIRRDLVSMRNLSRQASEDDGYIVRFLSMCETHIVGPEGFKLQNKALDKDGKLDKPKNDIIEKGFKRWGKKGVCDVTGQYSWTDIQTIFIKTVAQDGAVLVREVRGYPNEFGYAVQLLESDHLDLNYNIENFNGNRIKCGVELDSWGKHVAYHILTVHPGERTYYMGNTRYERIPANEIINAFYPFRLHQTIGVPWSHAAMLEMMDLYGYREAEIVGSRTAASKMFAYEADTEVEPAEDDLEEEFVEELEPGAGIVAPYGYKIKTLDFGDVGKNFKDVMKTGLRGSASGLDVNYNSLANDLEGVNFSSLRHGVLEDRDSWMKKQRWMRETLLDRVFGSWLEMSLVMNVLGDLNFYEYEKLNLPAFQGRRWEWVNPLQDEKANSEAIGNKTKSPQSIIRARGQDPEETLRELQEWHEATKNLPNGENDNGNNNKEDDEK